MTLFQLAQRNLWRRRWRFFPAFVNLVFFGLAFTVLAGIGDSFVRNLESRAVVYYGGQATLLTYQKGPGFWDDTALAPESVAEAVHSLAWVTAVSPRHVFRQPGTEVVAGGRSVNLRLLVGQDPNPKMDPRWDLVAGTSRPEAGSILLPLSVAQRLSLTLGGKVTLLVRTYSGQRTTAHLLVSGIYRDDPIFGRGVAFVDRGSLNRWSGKPGSYASENSLWIDGALTKARFDALQQALGGAFALWPHPADKKAFLAHYPSESWDGTKSVLFRLEDHIHDLGAALTALRVGLTLVALLLLLVAALGLGSTLRVLLHERTREIGTLRALGMGQGRVFWLLGLELEIVACLGALGGAILGYGTLGLLSSVSWDGFVLIQPLLIQRSLGYRLSLGPGLLAVTWASVAVLVASFGLLHRASSGVPAEALASGN